MSGLWLLSLIWLSFVGAVLIYYKRDLLAFWSEPVLRFPVMIIESDDWGAGPVAPQAAALHRIMEILMHHRDRDGRHPVMTLALVLAVPDGHTISRDGHYHRRSLTDSQFAPVLQAIGQGRNAGVFVLQLHGMEHYWPASLLSSTDRAVRSWLVGDTPAMTEQLPSHLQSRWVDASVLPSRPIDPAAVAKAVAEEVNAFEEIFGNRPKVVVPPTFVWTGEVEQAWAKEGIEFVVTPGLRSACRNAAGLPDCDTGPFLNGQQGAGVTYIVRNDYFEPERGHKAEDGLAPLAHKWLQRRPCLLETHRSNFIVDAASSGRYLAELDRLYVLALTHYPDLRFMSSEELGRILLVRDPRWIEEGFTVRMMAWVNRVRDLRRFWKLARVTGLAWIMNVIDMLARLGMR